MFQERSQSPLLLVVLTNFKNMLMVFTGSAKSKALSELCEVQIIDKIMTMG